MEAALAVGLFLGIAFIVARFVYTLFSTFGTALLLAFYRARRYVRRNEISLPEVTISKKLILFVKIGMWLILISTISWVLFVMFLPLIATIGIL